MKTEFIVFSSDYMQQHHHLKCQKKTLMDGRFKRFLSSLNAVLHTPQELYTHHYVCLDVLPHDSLQQVLLHITVIQMLTIM